MSLHLFNLSGSGSVWTFSGSRIRIITYADPKHWLLQNCTVENGARAGAKIRKEVEPEPKLNNFGSATLVFTSETLV